jgi:hypothetical protein
VRDLGTGELRLLPDTETAHSPFFSPDGRSLGYFDDSDRTLRTVTLATGYSSTLATTFSQHRGATWTDAGTLVFARHEGGLGVVSEDGGSVRLLAAPDDPAYSYVTPHGVPGSGDVFITIASSVAGEQRSAVAIVDGDTGEVTEMLEAASDARYVEPGYLLHRTRDSINAVAFDLAAREVTGTPFTLIETVATTADGPLEYDASPTGALVYVRSDAYPRRDQLTIVAVDGSGTERDLGLPPGTYAGVRVSPDGRRLAVDFGAPKLLQTSVGVVDLVAKTNVMLSEKLGFFAVWSPDGEWIATTRIEDTGSFGTVMLRADLSGVERVLRSPDVLWTPMIYDFLPGGSELLAQSLNNLEQAWIIDASGEDAAELLELPAAARALALSPSGRWLAFVSADAGQDKVQIFERATGRRWVVASGGYPRWSADGRTLYYWSEAQLFAVPVIDAADWSVGEPRRLFEGDYVVGEEQRAAWDVGPDGQTFYLIRDDGPAGWQPTRIDLVLNVGKLAAALDPGGR